MRSLGAPSLPSRPMVPAPLGQGRLLADWRSGLAMGILGGIIVIVVVLILFGGLKIVIG